MSSLSFRLAKALSDSRKIKWRPHNREQVLARLLVKRAEARQAGLTELETQLRQQIRWSLPMHHPDEAATDANDDDAQAVHDRI
nr:hypothetical protein [uncultured Sphingosinicella sp.]